MKRTLFAASMLLLLITGFVSDPFQLTWPRYFPEPAYDFSVNRPEPQKIELGRRLFYDPVLSFDSSISCASCHSPYNAFAHIDHKLSHGIYDSIGTRNAPALFNLAWQKELMWDGAVNNIEVQALAPISSPIEMHEHIAHVVEKLQRSKTYPALFLAAFNDSVITGQHVLLALTQFQLSLVSCNSKYDSVQDHTASFTAQEKNGYRLFQQHCNTCHREPMFTTYTYASNGLAADPYLNDYGRFAVTHNAKDSFLFKIPSLRNVEYTFPYMHDGRFATLYEVISYYTGDISATRYISAPLRKPIRLSSDEKVDLVAFLLTLSDKRFIFNTRSGPPSLTPDRK
jgi:cytochrome c peroxidase